MKINDRVKTTPAFRRMFNNEFTGVITEIDTRPKKIHYGSGIAVVGCVMATDENRPTKKDTVATVKTDAGDIRYIGIDWLEKI